MPPIPSSQEPFLQQQQQQQQTNNITTPHNNDVLCGRGGVVNSHPGNEQYREIVERKKRIYLTARFKREKRLIASSIVEEVRNMDPPGRFLMKDPIRSVWHEIGDEKARDKTSQALRENALNVRKQMEEENKVKRRLQQQEEQQHYQEEDEEEPEQEEAMDGGKLVDESKELVDATDNSPFDHNFMKNSCSGGLTSTTTTNKGVDGYSYKAQQLQLQQQQQPHYPAGPQAPWGYASLPSHGGPSQPPPLHHYPYSFSAAPQQMGNLQHRQQLQQQQQQQQQNVDQYYGRPSPPPSQPHSQYPQYFPNLQLYPQQQQQQQQQQNSMAQPIMLPPRVSSLNSTPPLPPAGIVEQTTLHPTLLPASMRQSTFGYPSSTINPPPVPAINDNDDDDHHLHSHITGPLSATTITPSPGPYPPTTSTNLRRSSMSSSRDSSPSDKHVQFQNDSTHDPSSGQRGNSNVYDIPLVINSKQSPSRLHPNRHHHNPPSSSNQSSVSSGNGGQELMSPPRSPMNHTSSGSVLSQSTPATPLAFLSGDFSVKTSDSLNHYLKELEDEISGDVGQEVELVAHAPLFYDAGVGGGGRSSSSGSRIDVESDRRLHLQQLIQQQQLQQMSSLESPPVQSHHTRHHHHHGGIPSYSRSTPRPHHTSGDSTRSGSGSGRRRKRHTGTHAPSNSGKVQLDLSTLDGVGVATSSTAVTRGGAAGEGTLRGSPPPPPPPPPTVPCGVMLTSPLRRSSSGIYRASMPCVPGSLYGSNNLDQTPTSPVFSLDLDKMSLCGTENVSQMGGSIGGASLCNVFDDHEDNSAVGASTLMDMTVSVGSQPSGGKSTSSSNYSPQSGLGLHHLAQKQQEEVLINPQSLYSDSESLIGVSSAIMDFSVSSVGVHSKEHQGFAVRNNNDNESIMGASSTGAMDMSVGSNAHSKGGYTGSSQNSSSGSGSGGSLSRCSRRSGSPASIDKVSLSMCEDGGKASLSE